MEKDFSSLKQVRDMLDSGITGCWLKKRLILLSMTSIRTLRCLNFQALQKCPICDSIINK